MQCISPVRLKGPDGKYRLFPCGRCCVCKSKKSSTWLYRLKIENKYSFRSYFITLDYDPEHIPLCERDDHILWCFNYKDVQKYHKLLRNKLLEYGLTFRFYLVSEYGVKGERPHYHELLFLNVIDESKIKYFKDSKEVRFRFYDNLINTLVADCWKCGSHTEVSNLTIARMMYAAGYTQNDFVVKVDKVPNPNFGSKKIKTLFDDDGVILHEEIIEDKREFIPDKDRAVFSRMSRKPGIGTQELNESFFAWYEKELPLILHSDGSAIAMPTLFKRKFKEKFPDVADSLVEKALKFMDQDINEAWDNLSPEQQQEQRKSVYMHYLKKSKKNKYKNL